MPVSVNSEGSDVSDLELMKSMIRWDNVVGYKVRNLIRTVNTGVDGLSAKLVRVYTGPKYNGYVFKIRNESRKEYAIDVKSLTLGVPNVALLSQVDRKILESRKSKDIDVYTCYADYGIGVIIKRPNRNLLETSNKDSASLKFEDYFHNHKNLMNIIEYEKLIEII